MKDVDIWFQDETRIGQQGSITRVWHYKGQRPDVVKQQQFLSTYIYGAICPKTGQSAGLVLPYANSECMKLHLQEISKNIAQGRHAVLVVDGALWHQEQYNLPNVTLLKLPPYSPELSPIEQVWQYIKQHWLSNHSFDSYDDIVDSACRAWLKFSEQLDVVKSITARSWALF
ncbi:MAG: IS630 family transposase [Moraxella sp.]|nr:IS630 family transposase [Moraxella sp.]